MSRMDIKGRAALLGLLASLAVTSLLVAGCSVERVVAEEGQLSCIDCHTDRKLLKADLKAGPKPAKIAAESEGEG
jgi:hypothetical protein